MSEVAFYVNVRDGAQLIADAAQGQLEKMSPTKAKQRVAV